jgi:Kef-type K+ transport system membrane component KefB
MARLPRLVSESSNRSTDDPTPQGPEVKLGVPARRRVTSDAMPEPHFGDLLIVAAFAFAVPFLLGLFPGLRLPSVVLEIVAGIVIGPSILGIVEVDQAIEVIALIGLGFVLFLAGLEIEFDKLRGPALRVTAIGFALSFGLALVVAFGLKAGGLVETPLLVAIILCATSLGVLIPVLKDAGEISTTFGQLIIGAATIADFGAIILLSLFFSGEGGVGATLLLLGALALLAVVVYLAVRGAEGSARIRQDLVRLQDTTAQIRVRAAIVLFVGFAAIAETLGLEVILGTFIAGVIISLLDRDEVMTHPDFRGKLEAMGFGFFIPVFFVASGVRFDLDALVADASNLIMLPIFLGALVLVRGLPALLYRRLIDGRRIVVAGLMQATSLPFIVAATAIGLELGLVDAAESAALIGAGLLSVLIFPLVGLTLLRGRESVAAPT